MLDGTTGTKTRNRLETRGERVLGTGKRKGGGEGEGPVKTEVVNLHRERKRQRPCRGEAGRNRRWLGSVTGFAEGGGVGGRWELGTMDYPGFPKMKSAARKTRGLAGQEHGGRSRDPLILVNWTRGNEHCWEKKWKIQEKQPKHLG